MSKIKSELYARLSDLISVISELDGGEKISKGEAKRLIKQGAIEIDGEKIIENKIVVIYEIELDYHIDKEINNE